MAVLLKPTDHGGSQDAWNKLAGGAYYLAGGEPCIATDAGTSSPLGGQYCTKCGKAILPVGATTSAATTGQVASARAAGAADGRVRRNIHRLAALWMINGILRLAWVGSMMLFGRFIPPMRIWMGPGGGRFWGWGLDGVFSRGFFSLGIVLAFFGVLHLVLAWGLFEREPWARFLGLALGFLALLRFPLGTALGIYTLWVLLPENSGSEYDRLAQNGGHMNSAAASSH